MCGVCCWMCVCVLCFRRLRAEVTGRCCTVMRFYCDTLTAGWWVCVCVMKPSLLCVFVCVIDVLYCVSLFSICAVSRRLAHRQTNWHLMLGFRKTQQVTSLPVYTALLLMSEYFWVKNTYDFYSVLLCVCVCRWGLLVDYSPCVQTEVRRRESESGWWPDSGQRVVWTLSGESVPVSQFTSYTIVLYIVFQTITSVFQIIVCEVSVLYITWVITHNSLQESLVMLHWIHELNYTNDYDTLN